MHLCVHVGVYTYTHPVYILHLISCINFQEFTKVLSSSIWLYPCSLVQSPCVINRNFRCFCHFPFFFFFCSTLETLRIWTKSQCWTWAGMADLWFRADGSDHDRLCESEIQIHILTRQDLSMEGKWTQPRPYQEDICNWSRLARGKSVFSKVGPVSPPHSRAGLVGQHKTDFMVWVWVCIPAPSCRVLFG